MTEPEKRRSVTGVDTLFLSELKVGDRITVSGETRTVTAIASDTSLTVASLQRTIAGIVLGALALIRVVAAIWRGEPISDVAIEVALVSGMGLILFFWGRRKQRIDT